MPCVDSGLKELCTISLCATDIYAASKIKIPNIVRSKELRINRIAYKRLMRLCSSSRGSTGAGDDGGQRHSRCVSVMLQQHCTHCEAASDDVRSDSHHAIQQGEIM